MVYFHREFDRRGKRTDYGCEWGTFGCREYIRKRRYIMKMEIGKTYIVKKDIFDFIKGEIVVLEDKGYQAYYGEHNFVFVNEENQRKWLVLRDNEEDDKKVYYNLEEYFEEKKD